MPDGVGFMKLDVRGSDAKRVIDGFKPDVIVHLASIVSPSRGMTREFAHDVDVKGTRNVLDAAISHGVRRLVVTSSGAAYGYHADNPVPLSESDPVQGKSASLPIPITSARWRRLLADGTRLRIPSSRAGGAQGGHGARRRA
jgi:nucleoside-diphosphate-sugar epimerase